MRLSLIHIYRQEGKGQTLFAHLYYWMVRKAALPEMPKGGFDVYLLDQMCIRDRTKGLMSFSVPQRADPYSSSRRNFFAFLLLK